MRPHAALVIGAGNVGALFDTPQTQKVLSHAHAYATHPQFELAGFVDIDQGKAAHAASVWGCAHFSSIRDAFNQRKIDVVSIAVPDDMHASVLRELKSFACMGIVVEKPIARSVEEGRLLSELYQAPAPLVAVNYVRRYIPQFQELRRRIASGELGPYLAGSGHYGKGIVHNGSHMIDLVRYLVDEVTDVDALSAENDAYLDDPSVEGVLRLRNGKSFHLVPVSCRAFTIFELDLIFERGRIRVADSGFRIEEQSVEESHIFSGYRNLSAATSADTGMGRGMFFLVDNLHHALLGRSEIACTMKDALRDLEICATLASFCGPV